MVRVDERQGAPEKLVLVHQAYLCGFQIKFKFGREYKNWQYKYRRRFVGVRKTENLIESACFYLKISRFHMFCLYFSQVRMF